MTVSGIRNHKWAGENISTLKLLIDALCIKAKILQIDFFSFFLTSFLWSKLLSEEKKKKAVTMLFQPHCASPKLEKKTSGELTNHKYSCLTGFCHFERILSLISLYLWVADVVEI